jgi:serine phosphatase RsbU (regulator of sigma subunit)
MNKKIFLIFFLPLLFQSHSFSQNQFIDSLSKLVKTEISDTNKVRHLDDLCWEYQTIGEFDSSFVYGSASLKLAEHLFKTSSSPLIKLSSQKDMAQAYSDMGVIYKKQGDYSKCLEYYLKALKINEGINDKKGIAKNIGNIGIVYYDQRDYDKALEYYFRSLKLREELGNKSYIAIQLGNIGAVYYDQRNYPKALEYYLKALKIKEEINDEAGLGITLGNIGNIYYDQADYDKALEYFNRSLKMKEKAGDAYEIAITLGNIGSLYNKQKKYADAEKYLLRSLMICDSSGILNPKMQFEKLLSELYFSKGDFRKAYLHQKEYTVAKDTLFNIEKHQDLTRKEISYDYEKKEAAIKAENDKQAAVAAAESKKQKTVIIAVCIGLILMVIFTIFIFRSLHITQKQKRIIEKQKKLVEEQKDLVEEKHKEISDSINYAERIQRALLANRKILDENLSNYFILFKPKDVVSGDFYWATKLKNDHFALVTADSTGHGVPGAIMSMLNIACLKESVSKGIIRPDLILNETRTLIIENLKNDGSAEGGKDGMDCTILTFDFNSNTLQCAAANNPVWIIRDRHLIEIRPDRMPVGKHEKDDTPFSLTTYALQKGDLVYTLTDGFADQFGGTKGKKFKNKQLQELLVSVADESMQEQKQKLDTSFNEWKRNLEQIDDVCLIGIRI